MTECQDCGEECKRRTRCKRCKLLVCGWCLHHVHKSKHCSRPRASKSRFEEKQRQLFLKMALLGRRMVEQLDEVWGPEDTSNEEGVPYIADICVEEPADYLHVLARVIELAKVGHAKENS